MKTHRINLGKKYILVLPENTSMEYAHKVNAQITEWLQDEASPIILMLGNNRLVKVTKRCTITKFLLRYKEMLRRNRNEEV